MNLIKDNIQKLDEVLILLEQLSDEDYRKSIELLSNASLGQHLRHILEFYICLQNGMEIGQICYDNRDRDKRIEESKEFARIKIAEIKEFIYNVDTDLTIQLQANYSLKDIKSNVINSSLYRELAYAMDHTIHHLAIIKIGLKALNNIQVDENFGVAPSTIRYKQACAQ